MAKQTESVLVVASGDRDIVPVPRDIVDLGIEWDAVDIEEDEHGSVRLYGARNVPEPLVSEREGRKLYWRRKPPVAALRPRNAEVFRAHLRGATYKEAGSPLGLSAPSARVIVRRVCLRALRYSAGIELGWYRDIEEMGERLFLTAKEAEVAAHLGKIYWRTAAARDPSAPSEMKQARRIIDSYWV